MATGRELNINSLSLTDGQPAHTAPTSNQRSKTAKGTSEAEGGNHGGSCARATLEVGKNIFYGIYARISAYMSCWLPIFHALTLFGQLP